MAPTHAYTVPHIRFQLTTHLSTHQKDERLSWPGWLICSGWFIHNSSSFDSRGPAAIKLVFESIVCVCVCVCVRVRDTYSIRMLLRPERSGRRLTSRMLTITIVLNPVHDGHAPISFVQFRARQLHLGEFMRNDCDCSQLES